MNFTDLNIKADLARNIDIAAVAISQQTIATAADALF
jgi:hypothetical protein